MQVASLDRFLAAGTIAVDLDLARDAWLHAASAYRVYADRRQANGDGWPRCILADFMIGAHAELHAELHADLLLTYNSSDFERMFPNLEVIVPPALGSAI